MKAVIDNDLDTIDDMLAHDFDINRSLELKRGLSAAAVAAESGNLDMLHYLFVHGADLTKPSGKFGITPLMAAVTSYNTAVVEFILSRDVTHQACQTADSEGMTPL